MRSKRVPKEGLYDMYRESPPDRNRGASHVAAYWDGYEGRPCKFVRTSYGAAAWRAGRDNRKAGPTDPRPIPHN